MLSDHCLSVCSVLSCPACLYVSLSVTLVYCDQTIGWIKVKLGTQVGHTPGYIFVRYGPISLSPKGAQPTNFWPISVVA